LLTSTLVMVLLLVEVGECDIVVRNDHAYLALLRFPPHPPAEPAEFLNAIWLPFLGH